MKTIKAVILFSALLCLSTSCDNDNIAVDKDVKEVFEQMYPSSKRVKWEIEKGCYVVDFYHEGYDKEAWFNSSAIWLMTETDYKRYAPPVIMEALSRSDYGSWHIEDVDFIEALNKEPVYIVEVEKGEHEMKLYFSESGERITGTGIK